MIEVASRELRNRTRALLDRVERGEHVVITVRGRPMAVLQPLTERPRWVSRSDFVRRLETASADRRLASELHALLPGTTDELPWR